MSIPVRDFQHQTMQIGLIAYGIDGPNPSLVFVRVPTERGRWVLTDRCVAEVPCEYCGAITGEPCRRNRGKERIVKHGAGTHVVRRVAWQAIKRGRNWQQQPKLRIPADDLAQAMEVLP